MRTGAGFDATAVAAPVAAGAGFGGGQHQQQLHSAWHSPVPYLFGGLAAMLGLIAFALLVLACSYWKLSGYLDGGDGDAAAAAESGEADGKPGASSKAPRFFEEGIVVIMAGEEKPTFLATPICSRASSFGDQNANTATNGGNISGNKMDGLDEEKQRDGGLHEDVRVSIQTQSQNQEQNQEQ